MTKNSARLYASMSALLAVQLCAPTPAVAKDAGKPSASTPIVPLSSALSGSAHEDYEQAKILYADKDFGGAVLKFQSAFDASGDPRLLWNMAAAEKNLRHYGRVEKLVQAYLEKSGPLSTEAERDDAQALLSTVQEFVALVALTTNEPDARVFVDEVEVAKTPLAEPLHVDMGERLIRVSKPGFDSFSVRSKFMGGTKSDLNINLTVTRHDGSLQIAAEPAASIFVDGKLVGKGKWQARLPSGHHQVEVSAPEREAWHLDTVVEDNQTRTLFVTLRQRSAKPAGVPPWLWLSGGVVVAGLASVGGYYLFKPQDKGPPDAVPGSFATVDLR